MTRPIQTLLLVEDFAPDRELYRRFLMSDSECVYSVLEAESVMAGLALCQESEIDAILLDYSLPDGTGIEFLQALHTQSNGGSPPVVMVTGAGDERVAVQAIKLGAEDYLVKQDLTPELLQVTMRRAIKNAQLQLQLRQSEDRFRVSIENMLDSFGICSAMRDPTGHITDFRIDYLNAAAMEDTQLTAADLGRGLCEVFPAHYETGLFADYCRVVATGESLSRENLIYSDEFGGQQLIKAYDIHASRLNDGIVIAWRNVTNHKRLELELNQKIADLEQQQHRLQRLIDTAPIGIGIGTAEGEVKVINDEMLRLHGYTREEFEQQGMNWRDFTPPELFEQTEQAMERLQQEGIILPEEKELMWRDGSRLPIWISAMRWLDDTDEHVAFAVDLTRQKQAETAIQASQQRYQQLAEAMPQMVWTADVTGAVNYWNQQWYNYSGLSEAESMGLACASTIHPDDRDRTLEQWGQSVATGVPFEIEYRICCWDGVYHWFMSRGTPTRDDQGQVIGWIGTITNIDELKRSQAEREHYVEQSYRLLTEAEAAREEAEAANRSKDEFITIIAHELRSPLNSISGWAKLLQTRKFDEATMARALDAICRNTQAQVQLVEDLLDISRMIRGTLEINFAPVNWVNVIETVLEVVRPMADAKQLQLETHLRLTPQISGDFNRLQQIAVNLLTNAIKFTPDGGRVEVHLEQVDADVLLRVHDTGKGIAPEFLPHIFERYQQGQQNMGSKDGLGLGLAIVKNLVELHHGTITAESAGIGQGATFTVRLPQLDTSAQYQDPFVVDATSLAGIRVLAVDDDPDMLNLIAFVLRDFGAEVQAVTTARAALVCVSQFKPDILLSDLAMPEGDGYELVQQIKSYPEGQIPAIALTAYTSTTYRERSRLAGFQQHLTKPVDPEDLVAAILNLVKKEI